MATDVERIIADLEQQRAAIDRAISALREITGTHSNRQKRATQAATAPPRKRRRLSAAGRRAISEATKKRWALKRTAESAAAEQFGLALSGGGFRATLFHLGVVRFLSDANLLRAVRFISGVSGGAILAAHLGLNWDRYMAGADSFETAAREVVRFTQTDLRNRVIRRWLVGWLLIIPRALFNWSRTGLLKREYYGLYGHSRLDALPSVYAGNRPRVVLQCASLTTGQPCAFGRSGFMSYEEEAEGRGIGISDDRETSVAATLEVAFAVSASSAFPPMFPPVRITNRDLGADVRQFSLAEGDLSEQARRRAAELSRDADLRLRAPGSFWQELGQNDKSGPRDPRLPPAGAELIRQFQGQQVCVTVLEHGFEYKGKRYESLSAIASQVTGTRWNGFAFFRLNKQAVNG